MLENLVVWLIAPLAVLLQNSGLVLYDIRTNGSERPCYFGYYCLLTTLNLLGCRTQLLRATFSSNKQGEETGNIQRQAETTIINGVGVRTTAVSFRPPCAEQGGASKDK